MNKRFECQDFLKEKSSPPPHRARTYEYIGNYGYLAIDVIWKLPDFIKENENDCRLLKRDDELDWDVIWRDSKISNDDFNQKIVESIFTEILEGLFGGNYKFYDSEWHNDVLYISIVNNGDSCTNINIMAKINLCSNEISFHPVKNQKRGQYQV